MPLFLAMQTGNSSVHEANRIVRSPCAYPVASFPPSTNCSTVTATSKVTLRASCTLSCREVPDNSAALEAAAAAGKVMVAAAAIPVAWADVEGGQYTTSAVAVTELQVRAWITAALTVVTAAEVEVLAILAVPVSRLPLDVHSQ